MSQSQSTTPNVRNKEITPAIGTVLGEILKGKHIILTYYTVRALTLQNYLTWCHEKTLVCL